MANVIKHKRGSGSDPGASDLILGELAIRTDTGKLFTKMDSGAIAEIAGGGSDIAINTLSSSSGTGGGSATFNGSAYRFTLSQPPNVSAAQLLVSINGVIQKPVAGTGQPSEGFSVDGTDIILGDAPATGSDFFILTFRSLGVSEPADNSVTSAKIADGAVTNAKIASGIDGDKISNLTIDSTELADNCITSAKIVNGAIVNADINASAAIAGTKISPSFTSNIDITNTLPKISLVDSDNNDDFDIKNQNGTFIIADATDSADRLTIASNGQFNLYGNVDISNGIDITGAITGTGDLTIDTNTLHVDSSNNRVGIGTTSPATILHISQTNPELRIQGTNGNGGVHKIFSAGINSESLQLTGASNLLFNADTQFFRSSDEGTEYMRIDSSGRVLIGSTTADDVAQMLKVARTSGTARLAIQAANDGSSQLDFADVADADIGRIQYDHNSNYMALFTNNSERMRITDTGQLLLGETSAFDSNVAIQFRKDNAGSQSRFIFRNRGNNGSSRVRLILSTLNRAANADKFSGMEMYQSGGLAIFNGESDNAHSGINLFSGNWASLRLKNGNVSGNDVAHIAGYWGTSNGLMIEQGGPQSGTFKAIRFTTSHYGGERGYIGVTLGGTSYNTSSDYRMKQDVVDLTGAIDRVKSFKPRRFKWKEDPTYTVDGFLAHEASTVVPESVDGEKDAVDENGDPVYQCIDQSKLVPLLVAALQEAVARIEALEAK